jgi:hypothetical protein
MTDKLIKFFKTLVLIQAAVLALVAGFRYLTPNLYATAYRAHNSSEPESFIITANTIDFIREDGSAVAVWSGNEEIDLMTVSSLADVKSFNVDVPSGTYKQFAIHFSNNYKVKGSVVVNGTTTYYTKAAHTGHGTGPAELETLNIAGQTISVQSHARDFNPRLKVGSGVSLSSVHILVDAAEFLTYYDGTGNAPSGMSGAGMCLPSYLPVAITFGAAAKKEVYTYTASGSTGEGRLTIIYDSNDVPVSASARPRYINNDGLGFMAWGRLMGGTGAVELEYVKKNANGSVWIKMYDQVAMAYLGETQNSDFKLFENFTRSSHSGTFVNKAGQTTAYTAVKIE